MDLLPKMTEDEGSKAARRIKEEEELGIRKPASPLRWAVPVIAFCWSAFQLSLSSFLLLDSTYIRAIHLAFAFLIVFLSYPTLRRDVPIPGLRWLGEKHDIPLADIVMAILAAGAALYIAIDYEGIARRVGRPSDLDMVIGIFLFALSSARSR